MHFKNAEALSSVFDNFEHLNDDYRELPKKAEAEDRAWNCLKEKGISVFEVESLINLAFLENERQGFIYGFRYAVELLIGGVDNESDKH